MESTQPFPVFDPLLAFGEWYLTKFGLLIPPSPFDGVVRVGAFSGTTLYRAGDFQVQLWICDPNSEIRDHSHPNVDTLLFYLSGQIYPRLNGKSLFSTEELAMDPDRVSPFNGRWVRIRPGDVHGATIGPLGGAFINMEHWRNGVRPKSVELDWSGHPIDESHASRLQAQAETAA